MGKSEPSSRAQVRGAVELAGRGFDRVTGWSHALHRGISGIPLDHLDAIPAVSAGSRATRLLHDRITDGVYAAVQLTGGAIFGAAAAVLRIFELLPPRNETATDERMPSETLADLNSALNGICGDFIAVERNPLAVRLGFYADGRRLRLGGNALAALHPNATDRLAIFVHGLCCNERSWRFYVDAENPETEPYASRLTRELGFTPYFARYNSGLHVSQNGRLLAREIARLVAAHPVAVREIALIGHSMGGLVSRAACHAAATRDADWARLVSNVICLGAPHLGAPLEKAAHVAASGLDLFRLTAPVAEMLRIRSVGIQDLRHGYTADQDWRGRDPRHEYLAERKPIRQLPNARYHFIGSSLGVSDSALLGRMIGDGLVRLRSSTARELAGADTAVLFGAHHVRLLNHPAVYREIRRRLGEARFAAGGDNRGPS